MTNRETTPYFFKRTDSIEEIKKSLIQTASCNPDVWRGTSFKDKISATLEILKNETQAEHVYRIAEELEDLFGRAGVECFTRQNIEVKFSKNGIDYWLVSTPQIAEKLKAEGLPVLVVSELQDAIKNPDSEESRGVLDEIGRIFIGEN